VVISSAIWRKYYENRADETGTNDRKSAGIYQKRDSENLHKFFIATPVK